MAKQTRSIVQTKSGKDKARKSATLVTKSPQKRAQTLLLLLPIGNMMYTVQAVERTYARPIFFDTTICAICIYAVYIYDKMT